MTSSDLIRTPIVDKNGKQTTVLRKPASGATTKSLTAAKPSSVTKPQNIDRLDSNGTKIEQLLKEQLSLKARRLSNKRIGKILDDLQPETLDKLQEVFISSDDGEHVVRQVIQEAGLGGIAAPLNNLAMFYDPSDLEKHKQRTFNWYINGLYNTHGVEEDCDFSKEPEEVQRGAKAVLHVSLNVADTRVRSMNISGGVWTFLNSAPLTSLIASRPEDADKILSFIETRPDLSYGRDDCALLSEVLDSGITTHLMDGVL